MARGGARPGAGTPQRRINLNLETARILRTITRAWRAEQPEAQYTPSRVVEDLIYREALSRAPLDSPERTHLIAIARGEIEE